VQGVSLEVAKGEFLAVMGPSGSGKSTLLNLIGGLDRPTEGDVILDGRSTRGFTESDWTRLRRERIGIVFQFFNLLPGLTARENVALPLLLRGDPDPENRVEECLAAVGLAHRGEHRPSELSGGEQQRVAVARALVHQPALLLADEPTGNLDSKVGREIVQLIKTLARQGGQTVVLATHSRSAAAEADRILLMRDGSVDGEGLAE
jgi:ABC-type lipoprotein export system ATPase subunit